MGSQCMTTPQSARDSGARSRLTTPLSRRATSPRVADLPRESGKVSQSPAPRRGSGRQTTPMSARPATQKTPGRCQSPASASGQISQLRQTNRRLTAPLATRNSASAERIREKTAEDVVMELKKKLESLEEVIGGVKSEMEVKESRLVSLEAAHASLIAKDGNESQESLPCVRDLIASFEQRTRRSSECSIPPSRRSLPPPDTYSPLCKPNSRRTSAGSSRAL